MSVYTSITQFNSPNYTSYASVASVFGMARSIDFITIHWWGDPNQGPSFDGVVAWLCNPRSGVSAHEVSTGTGMKSATLVDYENAGWHAGSATGNAKSIGIEADPRCRDVDYRVLAAVIADIWSFYGRIIPLRRHASWTATQCPGNYDLDRLYSMAMAAYNKSPAVTGASADEVKQAYRDILKREADQAGINTYTTNGMTTSEVRADLMASKERKDLEAREAAEYAKNEWVRNLGPFTPKDSTYEKPGKMIVVSASGAKRYNLENGMPLNNEVIPKGTMIDLVAKTNAFNTNFFISSYSKKNGQAVGIRENDLGIPVVEPEKEKPEWLQNLSDIKDQDFWTRSETPVLFIENGSVVQTLPINTKVRITHATRVLDKDLLLIEGTSNVIETVYLSDKEIVDPYQDLDKRVTAIESFIAILKAAWNAIFKTKLGE